MLKNGWIERIGENQGRIALEDAHIRIMTGTIETRNMLPAREERARAGKTMTKISLYARNKHIKAFVYK